MKLKNTFCRIIAVLAACIVLICGCGDPISEEISVSGTDSAAISEELSDPEEEISDLTADAPSEFDDVIEEDSGPDIDKDGVYTSKEDVALYIHTYGELPANFITKKEAKKLGWPGGSLDEYAEGKCIGGDHFGNFEGLLPEAPGREYRECDIDTLHAEKRGPKRLVYSNDGLIYYTPDHYESFELLSF
ncbi:MAG: ribonuclease [Lachnospiraceae bacterium]|nr:ribonuclease [Lachnospiraceae bacterium]